MVWHFWQLLSCTANQIIWTILAGTVIGLLQRALWEYRACWLPTQEVGRNTRRSRVFLSTLLSCSSRFLRAFWQNRAQSRLLYLSNEKCYWLRCSHATKFRLSKRQGENSLAHSVAIKNQRVINIITFSCGYEFILKNRPNISSDGDLEISLTFTLSTEKIWHPLQSYSKKVLIPLRLI